MTTIFYVLFAHFVSLFVPVLVEQIGNPVSRNRNPFASGERINSEVIARSNSLFSVKNEDLEHNQLTVGKRETRGGTIVVQI